jgi:hypothetical protein
MRDEEPGELASQLVFGTRKEILFKYHMSHFPGYDKIYWVRKHRKNKNSRNQLKQKQNQCMQSDHSDFRQCRSNFVLEIGADVSVTKAVRHNQRGGIYRERDFGAGQNKAFQTSNLLDSLWQARLLCNHYLVVGSE